MTSAALIITLLLLAVVMRDNKRLRNRCSRLEGTNSVLQDALVARSQRIQQLEQKPEPIVQVPVPTNEEINRWLEASR
jgi:hypothetical protein